jgi:drug/metabolite transporter (DMT)-like permease
MERPTYTKVIGQDPISTATLFWILLLVFIWASNTVVVKVAVRDIPPFWAAFLRFGPALPFVFFFIKWRGTGFLVSTKEFLYLFILALIMVSQIFLFNLGSQYISGGRISLIIFAYPLVVPLIAPIFIKEESLAKTKLIGSFIAFVGIAIALRENLSGTLSSTFKGDLIEISSCILLAINIVYNKRLATFINKWKILFWEFQISVIIFFIAALLFENFHIQDVRPDAWTAIAVQSLAVSVFCFLSWQYLIARHNSSNLSVFFFAAPLIGMMLGIVLLNEAFDPGLVAGCVLVGAGIFIVNKL